MSSCFGGSCGLFDFHSALPKSIPIFHQKFPFADVKASMIHWSVRHFGNSSPVLTSSYCGRYSQQSLLFERMVLSTTISPARGALVTMTQLDIASEACLKSGVKKNIIFARHIQMILRISFGTLCFECGGWVIQKSKTSSPKINW